MLIRILKDGKELASISIPDEFEIRIVHTSPVTQITQQSAVVQSVTQPLIQATELAATLPPSPKPAETEPASAEAPVAPKEVKKSDEAKDVSKIMEAAIAKAEETSKKLMAVVEKSTDKEKSEDLSLIRKVIEQLIE